MIEMLTLTEFLTRPPGPGLRTAHVCEGPGGFIEAIYDLAPKKGLQVRQTHAMTLRSTKTHIPGWRRAQQFMNRHREIRIQYGPDNSGNILRRDNRAVIAASARASHIFTADGGFDFSCDYTKQEQMVFPLLLASVKIGFESLKIGGVFILKLFDFYDPMTVDLLFFMSHFFDEWTLYKPGMSRPCNPEHYFIGKGFVGCSDEALDVLRIWCSMIENRQPLDRLFHSDSTSHIFHEIIEQLRKKSFHTQTAYLERVFDMIEKNDEEQISRYLVKHERTSYEWCVRFNVPMYAHRLHSIEESQNGQPVSYQ
jgi:hypothetical protein